MMFDDEDNLGLLHFPSYSDSQRDVLIVSI